MSYILLCLFPWGNGLKKDEYARYLSDKLMKTAKTKKRFLTGEIRPLFFCTNCNEKLNIRTSRMVGENHKEYFVYCIDCGFKGVELVRLFDHRHLFLETSSLEDVEKYISESDIIDNIHDLMDRYNNALNYLEWQAQEGARIIQKAEEDEALLSKKLRWILETLEKGAGN
ncbi:hypothetical protein VA599_07540 [Chromobacterium sp. TRC.1.1.SA]|uniref:Zinc ribbon domain-containing protein n=1 Tax=Chromobacterium indicum TaxID=3110228 RepID=A0ABV0CHD5_9NEIS